MSNKLQAIAVALLLAANMLLTGCRLWTVRPIETTAPGASTESRPFSAAGYVDSIWASRLIPEVAGRSVELPVLLAALDADPQAAKREYGRGESGAHFLVKGVGKITHAETASQNRTLMISLPGRESGRILIQVGPVFRGTALRDALGFIQFNQFINQLQFAEVSNELHNRVATSVVGDLDMTKVVGREVTFAGAFTLSDRDRIVITPVSLTVGGGH